VTLKFGSEFTQVIEADIDGSATSC